MKISIRYIIVLTVLMLIRFPVYAQSSSQFANSFRVQYGLYQYNSNKSEFLNERNKNFLNVGLTYRRQLGRITGMNLTGRYYKWQLKDSSQLQSYAAQAMFVLHTKRIGSNRHINRFTPYLGAGIGVQKHDLNYKAGGDSTFVKLYIPVEAGILFNISKRWSIGVFAEYKISASSDIKNLSKTTEGSLDIVNAAGVSLAWHFGKKKASKFKAPVVYTNPNLKETKSIVTNGTQNREQVAELAPNDSIDNSIPEEKPKALKDSGKKVASPKIEGIESVPDTITENKNKTAQPEKLKTKGDSITVNVKDLVADSLVKRNDSIVVYTDSINRKTAARKLKVPKSDEAKKLKPEDSTINKKIDKTSLPAKDSLQKSTSVKPVDKENSQNKSDKTLKKSEETKVDKELAQQKSSDKVDSLVEVIKQMNVRLDQRIKEENVPGKTKDTVIILPLKARQGDEPVISGLKQSYNKMGELIDHNYKKGRLTEVELDKVRYDANKIRESLAVLSEDNDVAFDEIEVIYNAIWDLQVDMELEQKRIVKTNSGSLQNEIITLRNERDSVLSELEKLKKKTTAVEKDSVRVGAKKSIKKVAVLKTEVKKDSINRTPVKPIVTSIVDASFSTVTDIACTVKFDVNSFEIRTFYQKELAKIVADLKSQGDSLIILKGYSDKSGNADYNKKLTQKRLSAVQKEFTALGIKKENIQIKNFGSELSQEDLSIEERIVVVLVQRK